MSADPSNASMSASADGRPAGVTVVITRRVTFAAAHALRRDDWDPERNRDTYGSCVNDHGHNYELEVTVAGSPSAVTGMIVNLRDLDRVLREHIVTRVDHRHLNKDVDFLVGVVPTVENLALAFWSELEPHLHGLHRLRLAESENNSAEIIRS